MSLDFPLDEQDWIASQLRIAEVSKVKDWVSGARCLLMDYGKPEVLLVS